MISLRYMYEMYRQNLERNSIDGILQTRTRSPGPPGFRLSRVALVSGGRHLRMRRPSTRKWVRSPSCRCALSCMLLG
jgi:hypothetical protein